MYLHHKVLYEGGEHHKQAYWTSGHMKYITPAQLHLYTCTQYDNFISKFTLLYT